MYGNGARPDKYKEAMEDIQKKVSKKSGRFDPGVDESEAAVIGAAQRREQARKKKEVVIESPADIDIRFED